MSDLYRHPPASVSEEEWALEWLRSCQANRVHPRTGRTAKEIILENILECDHPNPVTDTSVEWCPACSSVVQIKSEVVSAKVLHRQRDTISKLVEERDELKKMLREVAEKIGNARLLEREDHD